MQSRVGFRKKAEEPEIKLPASVGSYKKQGNSRKKKKKNIYFCFIGYTKPFNCVDATNWKILQEIGLPEHLMCLLRNLSADQEETEPDMEQQTGSKLGKKYVKTVYCHPAYLPYMQSSSCKMPGWMKHKLEWRLQREISFCHPYGRKQRRTKEPLDESKRGEWKSWLKTQHSKNIQKRIVASGPITSWQING